MKIYVDAMGGDLAPEAPVKGVLKALRQYPGLEIILAGKLDEVTPFLGEYEDVKDRLTLEEEPEVITNHESPVMGVRKKVNSATVQGMLKVRSGEADGFVSAGSTGATLAGGMFRLGRIPGVERPALAPLIPNGNGHFLLIDCGANVDCKPEYLVQFGIMGDAYMKGVLGMKNPRVGLVNIGTEEEQGNALTRETYPLLKSTPGIRFVGNAEARDLLFGVADVYVCEGFTGNIVLKSIEGASKALIGEIKKTLKSSVPGMIGGAMIKKPLKTMLKKYDPNAVGGAMMLGLRGLVVKGHGNSDAEAVKNAILQCIAFKEQNLNEKIEKAIGGLS